MKRVEQPIHIAIADYLRVALPPEWEWQTVDNAKRRKPAEQQAMKRMGNASGFPDIIILPQIIPQGGPSVLITAPILLEVKAPGNYASKEQKARHARLRALGYDVCVVKSVEDAQGFLRSCGVPLRASVEAV